MGTVDDIKTLFLKKVNKLKSNRVLRTLLHKAYLDLLENSFDFIKIYYIKDRSIHPKRDPKIYGSLVYECSLTEMKKTPNFLQKLFLKLQQNEFYEDYLVSRELLKLLFLPCLDRTRYYILLQNHILENGAVLQTDLKNYFNHVNEKLEGYFRCLKKTYNLKNFCNLNHLDYNMRLTNRKTKDFTKNRSIKAKYQEIQALKHQSLGIQLLLVKKISNAKTKKEIQKWCHKLTSFVCKPDELFCGYT